VMGPELRGRPACSAPPDHPIEKMGFKQIALSAGRPADLSTLFPRPWKELECISVVQISVEEDALQ
jgi:hypothetical protein